MKYYEIQDKDKTTGEWEALELRVPEHKVEARLKFWRELNQGAVDCRGEDARRYFRAIDATVETAKGEQNT